VKNISVIHKIILELTEHIESEIIVLSEGIVILKQYMPKKYTSFGIKFTSCVILRVIGLCMMLLCVEAEIGMQNFLDNKHWCYCNRTESMGYKLYVDSSSSELFCEIHTETMNCCGAVGQSGIVMVKCIG
jgi:hypothetical protein